MPDIFDFLSTRTDLSTYKPVTLPNIDTGVVQILPKSTGAATSIDPLDLALSKLKPVQKYEYTKEQQERYPTQYRPYTVLGSDIEDTYALQQSAGSKLLNGTLKGGITAAGTFLSSFLSIPSIIDSSHDNTLSGYNDDSAFSSVQNWVNSFENTLPNYYSQEERDNRDKGEWYKNIPTANFIADGIIKNLGFSIGAIGAAVVQDAIITAATAGTGTVPGVVATTGNTLSKMKNAWFGLSKAAQATEGTNMVLNGVALGNNLTKVAEGVSSINNIKNASKFVAKTYLSAQGEAAIEGYHTYLETREKLYNKALNGKLNNEQLSTLEQDAQDAGKLTAALNVPVLMISNALQFKNLLMGRGAFNQVSDLVKFQLGKEGLSAVSNYSGKQAALNILKANAKNFIGEGWEEGTQNFIGSSIHDYYVDKYNGEVKKGLMSYVLENAPSKLQDPAMWEEVFIGGLSGMLMGGFNIRQNLGNKERAERLSEHLNTALGQFNAGVKHINDSYELETDTSGHAYLKAQYNTVLNAKKYGAYDNLLSSLSDLKNLSVEDYNETFGTKFESIQDKNLHVNSLIQDAQSISKEIELTENTFSNPYKKDGLVEKIKRSFSPKTDLELERVQEQLFNDWKDSVTYGRLQLKKRKGDLANLKDAMRSYNVSDESLDYLINFRLGDSKGLDQYIKQKKFQLQSLKKEQEYFNQLSKDVTLNQASKDRKNMLDVRISNIEITINEIVNKRNVFKKQTTPEQYEALPESEKETRQQILALILTEETTPEQFEDYIQRREAKQTKVKEALETLEQTAQEQAAVNNLTNEQEQVAQTLADDLSHPEQSLQVATELIEQVSPQTPTVIEEVKDDNAWIQSFTKGETVLINGQEFKVEFLSPEGLIVKKEGDRSNFLIKKKDGVYYSDNNLEKYGLDKRNLIIIAPPTVLEPEISSSVQDFNKQSLSEGAKEDSKGFNDNNALIKQKYIDSIKNLDNTVTLYRGILPGGELGTGQFWTSDKEVAQKYANRFGESGQLIEIKIPEEVAVKSFMGMEGNQGFAFNSDIFSLPNSYNPQLNSLLTIGVDVFTKEEVENIGQGYYYAGYVPTNEMRIKHKADKSIPIYFVTRNNKGELMWKQVYGYVENGDLFLNRDNKASSVFTLPDEFVQVMYSDSKKLEKETVTKPKSNNVIQFLGENHPFSSTLQNMINNKRVELIC